MPRKVFVANEILTAGAVNTNLMDQAVMVFADAAARTAALGSPSEGMVTYLEDTDSLQLYTTSWGPVSPAITRADLPAGSVLQVVSATKKDTFSTTSSTYVDITGLTATITPSATTSKILVSVALSFGHSSDNNSHLTIRDASNNVLIDPTSPGSRAQGFMSAQVAGIGNQEPVSFSFLHEPSTTSAFTYKVSGQTANNTFYINRSDSDNNGSNRGRGISTIILMEVAG